MRVVFSRYLELPQTDIVFEIDIEIEDTIDGSNVWYPPEIKKEDTLVRLYKDVASETSDAIFVAGKSSFRVHKSVLSIHCKKLYELARDFNDQTPIEIQSAREEVFKIILDFVYTVNTEPELKNEEKAKELLVSADRFECVRLKLYVESVLVDRFLNVGNAVPLLIVADSYSCALLKEAAVNLVAKDPKAARKSDSWPIIEESKKLLSELMNGLLINYDNDDVELMTVTNLRKELERAKLELDGSREILVERLKTHLELGEDSSSNDSKNENGKRTTTA